ncbi:MAG: GatB/YqeY domain-containing protein [Firmicutes bacterium]|nr:GatB/YqeY domain-containing protein [Bacillota bacterium]
MRERILNDLKNAMKAQDKEKLMVMRMVKGAMQLEELDKKHELSDDEMIGIIAKQIKTRKESIVEFEKGKRQDLIDKTNNEIKILSEYMPEQLSLEEINKEIDKIFEELKPTKTDIGKVMGRASGLLKGKADLGVVNKLIKERLNNL